MHREPGEVRGGGRLSNACRLVYTTILILEQIAFENLKSRESPWVPGKWHPSGSTLPIYMQPQFKNELPLSTELSCLWGTLWQELAHFFSPNQDPKMSQETCTSNSEVRISVSLKEKRGRGRQVGPVGRGEVAGERKRERLRLMLCRGICGPQRVDLSPLILRLW